MATGGFLRFWVSGALILTAITAVQRAEAASSTDEVYDCTPEESVCLDDDTCSSCAVEYDQAEYEECSTTAIYHIRNSTTNYDNAPSVSCYLGAIIACCVDEASENACMDNDAYVEYLQCAAEALQVRSNCSSSELSCGDLGISAGVSSSKAARRRKPSSVAFACALGLAAVLLYA